MYDQNYTAILILFWVQLCYEHFSHPLHASGSIRSAPFGIPPFLLVVLSLGVTAGGCFLAVAFCCHREWPLSTQGKSLFKKGGQTPFSLSGTGLVLLFFLLLTRIPLLL